MRNNLVVYLSRNMFAGLPIPSLSLTEMFGDHGLNAEGLCLGWMPLSPCRNIDVMFKEILYMRAENAICECLQKVF